MGLARRDNPGPGHLFLWGLASDAFEARLREMQQDGRLDILSLTPGGRIEEAALTPFGVEALNDAVDRATISRRACHQGAP